MLDFKNGIKPRLAGVLLLGMAVSVAIGAEIEIKNAGFETWEAVKAPETKGFAYTTGEQPTGWNVGERRHKPTDPTTGICTRDEQVVHGGKASLKLEIQDTKGMNRITRFDAFPVGGEKVYRLSAWVKTQNMQSNPKNRNSGVVLQFIPGSKKGYWSDKHYEMKSFQLNGDSDWQCLSGIFVTRAGDESAGVGVWLQESTGTVWLDDLKLEEMSPEEIIAQEKTERTSKMEPTVWREHYGPSLRQVFSLYSPKTDKPAPVLVYIHGGGWLGGDGLKDANRGRFDGLIKRMNAKGIAVAVINYRYSPLPDPVYNAARAIQFLRYNAAKYNLDKTRFAATGFSAGATTSLWLALHDDLADPKAADPVLRESTRLSGVLIRGVQSSIDPLTIRKWGIAGAIKHSMICRAAGFRSNKDMDANYESKKDLYKEFSPITHASKDDPPVRIEASSPLDRKSDYIHHTRFAYEFKKVADQVGLSCDLVLAKQDRSLVPPVKDPNETEFLIRILTQE
jgi:acetyl esterase/lipase